MAYVTTPLEAEAGQTPGNKRRCGTTICRCLCNLVGGALLVSLLGCSLLLLVTVIYDQANTDEKLPEFKVESATMTQLNIEGPQLSAAWDITLLATNPRRRLESHYSFVQAEVRFRDGLGYIHTLVKQPVPSFVLNRRNHTRVGLKLGFWGQPGGQVVRGISDERKSEVVTFGVRLVAKVWFKKYSWLLPQPRGSLQVSPAITLISSFQGKMEPAKRRVSQGGAMLTTSMPLVLRKSGQLYNLRWVLITTASATTHHSLVF